MADIKTTMSETCVYGVQTLETMASGDGEWDAMKKPLKCGICNKEFMKISQINAHIYRCHTAQKAVKCDVCDKTFEHLGDYNRHRIIHTGQKPFPCDICGQRFSRQSNMTRHRACHGKRELFKCNVCGKCYTRGHSLARHTRTCHSGEKPFTCNICGTQFHRLFALKTHKQVHMDKFKCKLCSKTLKLEKDLDTHMKEHTTDMNYFSCDVCGQFFPTGNAFTLHQKSHKDGKYRCNICNENNCECLRDMAETNDFTENGINRSHVKVNTQPHNSSIKTQLQKAISLHQITPDSLMPLMVHHIEGGLYQCFVCGMVFDETAQREFDLHQLKHELEATEPTLMDYICIHCDTTFDLASKLLEHGKHCFLTTETNNL